LAGAATLFFTRLKMPSGQKKFVRSPTIAGPAAEQNTFRFVIKEEIKEKEN